MGSLWDVYNQLAESDDEMDKVAALEAVEEFIGSEESEDVNDDLLKTAAEYDAAGRIMARGFMEEMIKSAMAEEENKEEDDKEEDEEGTAAGGEPGTAIETWI